MDAEGVSTDPHEASMPLKAMPKLVRLEGRSFPRNRSKEESFLQSKLKDDVDVPSKLYNDSEIQKKPYRRTHEEIEDFVARRQRKPPIDRDNNPNKLFSYSTNKTDNSSIEKNSTNGYDLTHDRNGKGRYHEPESHPINHPNEVGREDFIGGRRRQGDDNDLSRVNFIPGSSSSKSLSERARYKYLQPYSSSIIVDGRSPSKDNQETPHSMAKDGNLKRRMLERSLLSMRREDDDRPPSKIIGISDRLQDRDKISGVISSSSRYDDFDHDKLSRETLDSNVPLNLHKKVSNNQAGANISTNTTTSTTLTMIRPNTSRKSSPASTVSSASSIALNDTLNEGNNGSNRSNLRSTDIEMDTDRDEYLSFHKTNDGKISVTDQNVINCLGRVSRNNDIIITSVPRSPSSSNSSSKEELDEYQKNNQPRRHLLSPHKSSNDKGLPQSSYSDSISASLISQMNSSPDNIARRGELMISPAPIEAGRVMDSSPTLNDREASSSSKPKYVLALSPPIPSDNIAAGNHNEDDDGLRNRYGSHQNTLSISSYLSDRRREEASSLSRRIPLSLSDRLDSDCSRLLSSKRDLIVERVIQPEKDRATEIDLIPSSEDHNLGRGRNINQKTDYNRFNGTNDRTDEDFSQSSTGSLRLKPFSKSLTGANVIQTPSASGISSLSFEKMNARNDNLFGNADGMHERTELKNKMIGLSRLQMEQFEQRDRFNPARPSSHMLSNRPDNDPYLDILKRGKSFPANAKTVQDGQSKNHLEDNTSGDTQAKISCDYCDHVFVREADLNDHIGRFHAGVKKYVCFVCHKRFKRKQSLENHVLMIHGVSSSSGPTPGSSGNGVINTSDGGLRNNGNSHPPRIPELPTREQMLMMMIEKGKANLAAGRRMENGDN